MVGAVVPEEEGVAEAGDARLPGEEGGVVFGLSEGGGVDGAEVAAGGEASGGGAEEVVEEDSGVGGAYGRAAAGVGLVEEALPAAGGEGEAVPEVFGVAGALVMHARNVAAAVGDYAGYVLKLARFVDKLDKQRA